MEIQRQIAQFISPNQLQLAFQMLGNATQS
jgi:hypothetical protein